MRVRFRYDGKHLFDEGIELILLAKEVGLLGRQQRVENVDLLRIALDQLDVGREAIDADGQQALANAFLEHGLRGIVERQAGTRVDELPESLKVRATQRRRRGSIAGTHARIDSGRSSASCANESVSST